MARERDTHNTTGGNRQDTNPVADEGEKEDSAQLQGGSRRDTTPEVEEGVWMKDGREEDNARDRLFLLYCEERRQENKQRQEDD